MTVNLGSAVLNVALSDADVERIAEAVRARASDDTSAEPWFDVPRAAEYLACSKKRIYDLKSEGRLRYAKEGTRLLFRREWLDAVIELDRGENDASEGWKPMAPASSIPGAKQNGGALLEQPPPRHRRY